VTYSLPSKLQNFDICVFSFSAGRLNFTDKRDDVTKHSYAFITLILSLLKEDGWLSPLAEEGFFSFFGEVYHVDHIQKRLNSNLSGMLMHKTHLQRNQYRTSMAYEENFTVASSIIDTVSFLIYVWKMYKMRAFFSHHHNEQFPTSHHFCIKHYGQAVSTGLFHAKSSNFTKSLAAEFLF
jgi:hypothetical protein